MLVRVLSSYFNYIITFVISNSAPLVVLVAYVVMALVFRMLFALFERLGRTLSPSLERVATVLNQTNIVELVRFAVWILAPVTYIPLARAALAIFSCVQLSNGQWYLMADMRLRCFSSDWWGLVPVGIVATLVYAVGVPLLIGLVTLFKRDAMLADDAVLRRYGMLLKVVRLHFWWMPLVTFAKRLVLVLISLLVANTALLCASLLAVIVGTGIAQFFIRPYFYRELETLDFALSLTLGLLLVSVLMLISADSSASRGGNIGTVLMVAALLILVVLSVYFIVIETRAMIAQRKDPTIILRIPEMRTATWLERYLNEFADRPGLLQRLGAAATKLSGGRVATNRRATDVELSAVVASGFMVVDDNAPAGSIDDL